MYVVCNTLALTFQFYTIVGVFFFFSSRRRHTRFKCDWSSDVCSSDLPLYTNLRILLRLLCRMHLDVHDINRAIAAGMIVGDLGVKWRNVDDAQGIRPRDRKSVV